MYVHSFSHIFYYVKYFAYSLKQLLHMPNVLYDYWTTFLRNAWDTTQTNQKSMFKFTRLSK